MSEVVAFTATGATVPLSSVADVQAITWSTGWGNGRPGGCQSASWTMDLDPNSTPPVLTVGRRVEIWDGPSRVFAGRLSEPVRGEPWELHATGLSMIAGDYLCLDGTGAPTSVPDTAVDQAIIRGLPWTRPSSVSASAYSTATSTTDLNRVSALLDAYCDSVSQRWAVFANGELVVAADPTVPKWLLMPGAAMMGVADDDYATHVYGRYVTTASGTPPVPSAWATVTSADDVAAAQWGRREYALDLTPLGVLTAGRAQTLTDARRAQAASRMGWTNGFEATPDDLTTLGGVPARLAQVKAGDMVRICGVLDVQGNLVVGGTVDVVIGETHYTDGDNSIQINPVGLVPRSLSDVLAAPSPPESTFTDRA